MTTLQRQSGPQDQPCPVKDAAGRVALSARDSVTATAIRSTATSAPRTSVCLDWLDLGSAAHRGKLLYLEGSLITFG